MFAVIGSNSKIGNPLAHALGNAVIKYARTIKSRDEILFDLNNFDEEIFKKKKIQNAILCAGITNIAYCENNPRETNEVNCIKTAQLIKCLNNLEIPVTIISSSSVFGIYDQAPDENSRAYSPTCRYALQKAFIEDYALGIWRENRVIRVTKVVAMDGIFKKILDSISNSIELSLFNNLRFSPISLSYLVNSIIKIINSDFNNVFHLSGEKTFSYYDFALAMNDYISSAASGSSNIIHASYCSDNYYLPRCAELNMQRTSKDIGILPQDAARVFEELNLAIRF